MIRKKQHLCPEKQVHVSWCTQNFWPLVNIGHTKMAKANSGSSLTKKETNKQKQKIKSWYEEFRLKQYLEYHLEHLLCHPVKSKDTPYV